MLKKSVTVGIPAFNEEKNVRELLNKIISQESKKFTFTEFIVISDASTDSTSEIVRKIRDKRIRLIINKKRLGKSENLNILFRRAKSDILVLLDADVKIKNKLLISNLIKPLDDKRIGMTGGNPIPLEGKGFIEKSIYTTYIPYKIIKKIHKEGNNIYGCSGTVLALSREFYKKVKIPKNFTGNDAFLYFSCLNFDFKFIHVPKAVVQIKSPSNIKDHVKQNLRWVKAHGIMKKRFGDIVDEEYHVPRMLFYRLLLQQFLKTPFHSGFIFIVNLILKLEAKKSISTKSTWDISLSTKK